MKQLITKQAWEEWSQEHWMESKKLTDWAHKQGYCLPLSIGQMVHFLSEHWDYVYIRKQDDYSGHKHWNVTDTTHTLRKSSVELCNALWEAVKQVLEQ